MKKSASLRPTSAARVVWASLCVGLLAWGCGDPAGVGTGDETDVALVDDMGMPQDATTDTVDPAPLPDSVSPSDVRPDGTDQGEPCESDEDCDSGLCVELSAEGDGVCSEFCDDDSECPEGFSCLLLTNTGGDATRACVPDDLCIDADEDTFGIGPGCAGPDCDDSNSDRSPLADELCDGIDNDCDTRVDDNPADDGQPCSTGFPGECAVGRTVCETGSLVCQVAVEAGVELCDGRDNDCDGQVDEDESGNALSRVCYDGPAGTEGIGQCAGGVQTCTDSAFGSCSGQVLPDPEFCDEIDNDCDGTVDEEIRYFPFWPDSDGDGAGATGGASVEACVAPVGYSATSDDCDDDNASVRPGATELPGDGVDQNCDGQELCFLDGDGDSFRSAAPITIISPDAACDSDGEAPASMTGGDCNDGNSAVFPGATEIVADGIDQNCDGREICLVDADNDGWRASGGATVESANPVCSDDGEATSGDPIGDCDDTQVLVNPATAELCDGLDNNCDGRIDEGTGLVRYWPDTDGDTFGDAGTAPSESCVPLPGFVTNSNDCDDENGSIFPGAGEGIADLVDQNCDGQELCFLDGDSDGYRPNAVATVVSSDIFCDGEGEADALVPTGDCNDAFADISPLASEIAGDSIDQNCDGRETCFVDADNDNFRVDGVSTIASDNVSCVDSGEATSGDPTGDCNDANPLVNPAAAEVVDDGVDSDCNAFELCFVDADDDGFRPNTTATVPSADLVCTGPGEAISADPSGDCNDAAPTTYPSAPETIADGIDSDCNTTEICYVDADDDGYRTEATLISANLSCFDSGEGVTTDPTGDCDDGNGLRSPGRAEVCDNIDNNCDARIDEGFSLFPNCINITCTGSGLIRSAPDSCIDDFGATSGGDGMQVYCFNGIERYCLSGEACPWRTGVTVDNGATCSRSGLGSDLMSVSRGTCGQQKGFNRVNCSVTGSVYFNN